MLQKKMFKFHTLGTLLSLLLLVFCLAYIKTSSIYGMSGDLAQNMQILYNLKHYLIPINDFLPSLVQFVTVDYVNAWPGKEACTLGYDVFQDTNKNHFYFHTYFLAYLFIPFVNIFGSVKFTLEFFNFLSFFGILYFSYLYLLKRKINLVIIVPAIILIIINPIWSEGILGNFYFDRQYILLGFLLILFTVKKDFNPFLFFLFLLISSSIAEKTIIYNILFLASYLFLFFFEIDNKKKMYITIGIILQVITMYIIFNFILISNAGSDLHYGVIFSDIILIITKVFSNEVKIYQSLYLCLIILPLLIPGSIFAKRLTLITILMILPNIFYTVGGAEKIQFDTHYHSLYFPFLVFTFLSGVVGFVEYLKQIKINQSLIFYPYFFIALLFYASISINIDNKINFKLNKINHLPFYEENNYRKPIVTEYYKYYENRIKKGFLSDWHPYLGEYERLTNEIKNIIPEDSNILVNDQGMPYVIGYKNVNTYPYMYKNADYLVASYIEDLNGRKIPNIMTQNGNEHNIEVSTCIANRLEKEKNFNFDEPILETPFIMIFGKNN